MKDTQGNKITEEEFTKDIGHRTENPHTMKEETKITEDTKQYGIYITDKNKPFFEIKLSCGNSVAYKINEIPTENAPCPCGNKNHWLVYYKENNK